MGSRRTLAAIGGRHPRRQHGATIRLGRTIFTDTARVASPYVGNDLRCASCHLDAGRRAGAAPMASAFVRYPTWSGKMQRVDTLEMRLQECLVFSMNGKAPPAGDPMLAALQAYAGWLATGGPVASQPLAGGGLPPLAAPSAPADAQRGDRVYAQQCASCHGGDGAGQRAGEWQTVLPLWGARSFNRGAGMAQPATAAAFIRANMPLGARDTLSEQEAWDVATFLDGHDRPADPREPAATVAADDARARAR